MALKLPDSAVPMGDFPVAKAVDIDFDDGENLQEKLDNGTLGGGGGSPAPEKQIKDWVSGSNYLEGDYIYHEGEIYRCLTSNSDVGFDETNWKKLTYGIDELENITRLTDFDEAIPEKGKNKIYYVNKTFDAYKCAQWRVESMYYDVSGIKQYRGVQIATSINGVDNIMLMREYYLDDNVIQWGAWQEFATMDKVKDGYVRIIKNNDTDADEAMVISYKNRDLFGVRIYKNDDSEHELRYNASGISYVKNGVTVWDTRGNTGVEDIPKTTLTPVFPNGVIVGSGGVAINYVVKNGWCNVNFAFNITSITIFSWTNIATGLPKPANSVNITLMNEEGKINQTIAIKINSDGSVSSRVPMDYSTADWWTGNISYPVAE